MISISELETKWKGISPYSGGFLLVSDDHPLSFHIGYVDENTRCFVVLNTGNVDNIISSKAIQVENVKLNDGSMALRFTLYYSSLEELFTKLCWDLMDVSRSAEKPIDTITNQYHNWLKLLQQGTNSILPLSKQKGLVGELLYFEEILCKYGEKVAIEGWAGPEGADQDFNLHDYWVEVKAITIAATEVMISSLQQLDRQDSGYLVIYFMDKTDSTGLMTVSLVEIVDRIHERITESAYKDAFECKLAMYGYINKDKEIYRATRFKLDSRRKYSVKESFPRLVRGNVPEGVLSTKYGLSLSAITSYQMEE